MEEALDIKSPADLEAAGTAAYQQGDYPTAAREFAAAAEGYRTAGDDVKAAIMANNSSVAYLQAGQPEAAYQSVDWTIAIFRREKDERLEAMALGNRAAALEALEDFEAAIADYEQSAEILKRIGEDDLRLDVMKSLSALQLRTGRSFQAVATMQAGLDGLSKPGFKDRLVRRLLQLPERLMRR